MKSRMISVVVSILATATLAAAETVTVEKPAGDGANTLIQDIDVETGDIVSERTTLVHVVPKADAETLKELRDGVNAEVVLDGHDNSEEVRRKEMKEQLDSIREGLCAEAKQSKTDADAETVTVFRLQHHRKADGSETAYVVGVDGVERPVVMVSPYEYDLLTTRLALLTTRLDLMWEYFNSSRDGRVKLHGRIMNTTIDEVAKEKIETHKDGYQHREKMPAKVDRPKVILKKKPDMAPPPKPTNISERQYEMRKRLAKRRKNPVKTITVEHDAVTGKDTVVK